MALYNKKKKIKKKCLFCKKIFKVLPSRKDRIFCSLSCVAYYGHKHKIIKPIVGGWNKNKKTPFKTREKQRQAKLKNPVRYWAGKTRPNLRKKDKSNWREFRKQLRERTEYKQLIRKVFKRDNYTCQLCQKRGGNLECHHIKKAVENKELIFSKKNCVTLCKECHNKTKGKEKMFENIFLKLLNV